MTAGLLLLAAVVTGGEAPLLPDCACAAARSAFMELMGSAGSIADEDIPTAWAAASS